MSRHKAGLGNASLWFFRQTQALVVRSEGAEVAAGPGHAGAAGALDNVRAFLRWALRSSHLLTRQGDIPTALFVFTNGAQAPKAPQQPSDLHSWWKVLLWGLLDAVLTQFLGVCSSEGAPKGFSPSWHMWALDEPLRAGGRWSWDVQGEAWLAVWPHPVPPVQPEGWGTPGAALARVSPHCSASHPPGTAWPPVLLRTPCSARPVLLVHRAWPGLPSRALMGTFLHCFFSFDPLIG